MRFSLPGGLTIRAALVLGFGATCGLWLFAGMHFTQRMADAQRDASAVNARYMEAQELLSTVRMRVLLGSVYVRDALLDPDPASAEVYRRQLVDTYETVDRALARYVPILDSDAERERVDGLRRDVAALRSTLIGILASDRSRWRSDAATLLGQTMRRREAVLRVSDEAQSLNRSAFVQQQQVLADLYATTQRHILETLGLALFANFGIAMVATAYAGRLERTLQRQRVKDRQNANDLQRLSAKLVTVQEEERRVIARELHDEVGQVLQAVKVELSLAQRAIEAASGPPRLLEAAQTITDSALHTVRDLSHLLHPALLDHLGLPAAIDWYLDGFGRRHGLSVELLHEGMTERLAPEIEAAAYRIVQEALTNVVKHAHATLAFVYLRRLGDRQALAVTIEDNGTGFEPAQQRRGLGLIGIRERVSHFQGSLIVDSAHGKGARITVELPARPRVRADVSEFDTTASTASFTPEVLIGKTAIADR